MKEATPITNLAARGFSADSFEYAIVKLLLYLYFQSMFFFYFNSLPNPKTTSLLAAQVKHPKAFTPIAIAICSGLRIVRKLTLASTVIVIRLAWRGEMEEGESERIGVGERRRLGC